MTDKQIGELWKRLRNIPDDHPADLTVGQTKSLLRTIFYERTKYRLPYGNDKTKLTYALRDFEIDPREL